ncbi:hypothetical protein WDU94_004255 [Cyamophila willieti]
MILQYVIIMMFSFNHFLCSETLDSGNDILYKALFTNQWYNVRPDIARLLVPIMAVAKKPKRFTYFGGAVDVCFRRFLAVIKFSYSVFTLMKNIL